MKNEKKNKRKKTRKSTKNQKKDKNNTRMNQGLKLRISDCLVNFGVQVHFVNFDHFGIFS